MGVGPISGPSVMNFRRVAVPLLLLAAIACGSDGGASSAPPGQQQITVLGRIFSVDDLKSAGFKTSKQYDVTDLPGAVDAWFGFFKADGKNPIDYEVRFYGSHEDAIAFGVAPADEASGEDAKLDEGTTSWPVGLKDRKKLASGGTADLAAWSGKLQTKYGDFVVLGNMVLLCEGTNSEEALERCDAL
ncbi:MAG: hypothetical protein IH868_09015, partial [Chloroflexi bacterium]|nr:hypothetical protein [Chloroflexota bacterium]